MNYQNNPITHNLYKTVRPSQYSRFCPVHHFHFCLLSDCGIPAVVDNGVFNFNGSNLVNDTATLECTGGYTTSTEIISDATITCQENGDWTSSAATCVKSKYNLYMYFERISNIRSGNDCCFIRIDHLPFVS